MFNGIRYSIAHFTLDEVKKSHPHKMKISEIYYILEGNDTLYLDDDKFQISKDE